MSLEKLKVLLKSWCTSAMQKLSVTLVHKKYLLETTLRSLEESCSLTKSPGQGHFPANYLREKKPECLAA